MALDRLRIVEKPALTSKGVELSIAVSRYSSDEDGNIYLTSSCVTLGEFNAEINGLIVLLERLREDAAVRFGD